MGRVDVLPTAVANEVVEVTIVRSHSGFDMRVVLIRMNDNWIVRVSESGCASRGKVLCRCHFFVLGGMRFLESCQGCTSRVVHGLGPRCTRNNFERHFRR